VDLPRLSLLDSHVDPVLGRYAFLAADPFGRLVVRDGRTTECQLQRGDAFQALKRLMGQYRTETIAAYRVPGRAIGLCPMSWGEAWNGWRRPCTTTSTFPMSHAVYDAIVAIDLVMRRTWVISSGFPETDPAERAVRSKRG